MVKCSNDCIPCCDFCIYTSHEEFDDDQGRHYIGGPNGCSLHIDGKHQSAAEGCGFCDDFHCFNVDRR